MSKDIQAYKFARNVLERLDELIMNSKYSDEVEIMSLNMKAKPFKDEDELLPLCYRCSHHSPLLNPKGNFCSNCGQPFVFSFASFEPLPLVEFVIPDDITDEEAIHLIDYVPNSQFDKEAEKREREALYGGTVNKSSKFVLFYMLSKIIYSNYNFFFETKANNRLVIDDGINLQNSITKDAFVSLMNKYNVSEA